MRHYVIKSTTGKPLYSSYTQTFGDCLAKAVEDGINLQNANLSHNNLSHLTLDGAHLHYADFTGCNLDGANLSESHLNHATFSNCTLYNTCLAKSDLQFCNFQYASFGGTDISGSNLSFSSFSNLSFLSLDLQHVQAMDQCYFQNTQNRISHMSKPPIIITGLYSLPCIFFDTDVYLGHHYQGQYIKNWAIAA